MGKMQHITPLVLKNVGYDWSIEGTKNEEGGGNPLDNVIGSVHTKKKNIVSINKNRKEKYKWPNL